jgi:hypothetical protein
MATQMNYSLSSIGFSNSKKALESGIRILSSHLEVGENGAVVRWWNAIVHCPSPLIVMSCVVHRFCIFVKTGPRFQVTIPYVHIILWRLMPYHLCCWCSLFLPFSASVIWRSHKFDRDGRTDKLLSLDFNVSRGSNFGGRSVRHLAVI